VAPNARSGALDSSFHPSVHFLILPIFLIRGTTIKLPCRLHALTCNADFLPKKDRSTHDLVNFYTMPVTDSPTEHISEIEAALLDAELFMKYQAPDKAIKRLRTALEMNGRSIQLRERLREICAIHKHTEEAARQCLALASIYIEREDFDTAHDRLLEAKQLDGRINIAAGLEAIRRARRPDLKPAPAPEAHFERKHFTLAGDLSAISVFDAIQVIENARLNGILTMSNEKLEGQVKFNDGRIVDSSCGGEIGDLGFQRVVEITSGTFEFQKTDEQFPARIQALSNTNLILDTLRMLDERKQ